MSLRDELKSASAALVKRRTITLPESGKVVEVRGLMLGQMNRVGEQKGQGKQVATQICSCMFDPDTGEQILNPGDANDIEIANGLSVRDGSLIIETCNELSGIGEAAAALGKATLATASASSTSSLSLSTSPSENSEAE